MQKRSHNRPRQLVFILLGFLMLGASIFTVSYWHKNQPKHKPRAPVKTLQRVTALPIQLSTQQIGITASGFVSAKYMTSLSAQVNGEIIVLSPALLVGKSVKKGDILAQIDPTAYQAALATATAQLANAESQYAQEQARSRLSARDAKQLNVKPTALSLRKPQLAAAKTAIDNAKAQVALAQNNLQHTHITAPFDALVQSRQVSLGDTVNANTVVAKLIATDKFTVKLTLNSEQIRMVSIGDTVTINDTTDNQQNTTVISRIDPGFDNNNRTIGVYIDIDKPLSQSPPLRLNSYVTATISGNYIADSVWIENSAIIDATNDNFVWSINADSTIAKAPIQIIQRQPKRSLIKFTDLVPTNIIKRPKDGLFVGQKITTEVIKPSHNKAAKHHKPGDQ